MPPKKDPKAEEAPKQPEPQPQPYELVGFDKFEYLSGVLYEGNWKLINGKKMKHGYGKLVLPAPKDFKSQSYEGNWFQDQMHGFGIYNYPDGSSYQGEWIHNQHQGSGIFLFANGTTYQGQWDKHLMHGTGEFTDHLRRKWKGEYRNGRFDSRGQNLLVKDVAIQKRVADLKTQILGVIDKLLSLLQAQNIEQFRINPYFQMNQSFKRLFKGEPVYLASKNYQEWVKLLQSLKGGEFKILRSKEESSILKYDAILAAQLQGVGQVVEVSVEGGCSFAFVCSNKGHWIIVAAKIQ